MAKSLARSPLMSSISFFYYPKIYCRGLSSSTSASSLIPETLLSMEKDSNDPTRNPKRISLNERKLRRRSLERLQIPSFHEYLQQNNYTLTRTKSHILQLNITRYCNQACTHCHVESSPKRTEFMSQEIFNQCFNLLLLPNSSSITTVDITGGAPELHPLYRQFIQQIRSHPSLSSLEIITRCNLTVLLEPKQEDLHQFYRDHDIRIIASLPCYSPQNVNQQRGANVFQRSIEALQRLNSIGYGQQQQITTTSSDYSRPSLRLDLVYNPSGAFLPPSQSKLEQQYKEILYKEHGITFNSLLTLTNMPIKRFADQLYHSGKLDEYMNLLVKQFNPTTLSHVMCRDTISIDWNGFLYDCDFNQQLDLRMVKGSTRMGEEMEEKNEKNLKHLSIMDIQSFDELQDILIRVDNHCYGCTAGAGSSCQGAF